MIRLWAQLASVLCAMFLFAPRAKADEPAAVRLGYFANVTHAQAVLGVASGEFEKSVAPAKFTSRVFNAGPSLVEALFAGEIDIGYVGPSPALSAHLQSHGQGIRVIAGAAANGVVIVARPGSGIEKMQDLRQKRIATPQLGNTQDVSARHYLLKVLGAPNVDNVIPVPNAEQGAMMDRGAIDAAWAVEPWASRLVIENHARVVGEEKDLWDGGEFTLTLVVVSPAFLEKHADLVERLLAVHISQTRALCADPKAGIEPLSSALEKLTSKRLSNAVVESALGRVKFTTRPLDQTMTTFAKWSSELNFTRGVPNVKTLVDTSILDKLEKAGGNADPKPASTPPAKPEK